ncbi:MAG: YARHG domain-containing protein [Thermoflexaceae bacterium]|nr:YARHG domain-containing protein [Thermoflexaceae bacterium]
MKWEPIYFLKLFVNQEDILEAYILLSDEIEFTDSQLKTFSRRELYLLRNGIFALSGREFKEEELMEAFQNYEWYVPEIPLGEFTWGMLNENQAVNVKLIQKLEHR